MGSIAHCRMLKKQRIIPAREADRIISGLQQIEKEIVQGKVRFSASLEDIHMHIETLLIKKIGPKGGKLHTARSRNDQVALDVSLYLRDALQDITNLLDRLQEALLLMAEKHLTVIMPGFTHLQHAQPTTLAHHLLAYEQAFSRDFDRLRDTYVRVNQSPLGAAAFASTGYPINREYTASLLGFEGLVTNTMDAVASRDFALETLADLSILMVNTSRLCEDLIIWSTSFVKFVTLDDAFCSTSSIMPQKKNPDTAEIMRAKSGSVFGAFTGAILTVKGLPMSYNRDLQELTPHIWRGTRDAKESLRLLIDMLSSARFDTERMKEEAGKGFSTSTELADTLVRTYGLPFRTAHNIVGRAVQKGDLSLSTLEEAAREVGAGISLGEKGLTQQKIDAVLDVPYSIDLRKAPGGPAPFAVKIALSERKKQLDADSLHIDQRLEKLSKAKEDMVAKARRMVA
jgi:argininosuccinate lyase